MIHSLFKHSWIGKGRLSYSKLSSEIDVSLLWTLSSPEKNPQVSFRIDPSSHFPLSFLSFSFPSSSRSHFSVSIEHPLGRVSGKGIIRPHSLSWEFSSSPDLLHGFEIYEYNPSTGDYLLRIEYLLLKRLRMRICGTLSPYMSCEEG